MEDKREWSSTIGQRYLRKQPLSSVVNPQVEVMELLLFVRTRSVKQSSQELMSCSDAIYWDNDWSTQSGTGWRSLDQAH